MPWSDDTRCLFCDGKLPLFRKLSQGQFCSKAHQEAYWKEQDQLAVAVLHRTHDALQAYKPAVPIESILGPAPTAPAAPITQTAPAPVAPVAQDEVSDVLGLLRQEARINPSVPPAFSMLAAEPVEYEFSGSSAKPGDAVPVQLNWALPACSDLAPLAGPVARSLGPLAPIASPEFAETVLEVRSPGLAPLTDFGFALGEGATWNWHPARGRVVSANVHAVEFRMSPVRDLRHAAAPCGDVLERIETEAFPFADTLFALSAPGMRSVAARLPGECEATSFTVADAQKPTQFSIEHQPLQPRRVSEVFALPADIEARSSESPVLGTVEAVAMAPSAVAIGTLQLQPMSLDPAMAWLTALPAPAACNDLQQHFPISFQAHAWADRLPSIPTSPKTASTLALRVQATEMLPVELIGKIPLRAGSFGTRGAIIAAPLEREVSLPRLALEPKKRKAAFDHLDKFAAMQGHSPRQLIAGVTNFWNHAPRDLKMLLFAVPLALGLAFHPSLPKVSVQAPQGETAKDLTGQFQEVLSSQMASVKKAIADRAAVGLDENFRQGLDNWMGNSGSTAEWAFDQAGFVLPGRVALYQPSLGLKDYELQFLGAVDKGALSWVVRAADFQNYYVVKLVVLKGGAIPKLGITRYAVVDGKPVDRVDTPVALNARNDSLYRVSMEMNGDRYALSIQGQVIDAWTEKRFKHGGVGFFTNRGEQSRIGWVQITHQYDMVGRLFAYLAP